MSEKTQDCSTDQVSPEMTSRELLNELLVPHARNSRTHSEDQIARIARSIERLGFLVPVLVDGEGGIIAGHGRTMAALKLKVVGGSRLW